MAQATFKSIVTTSAIIIIACLVVGYFVTLPQWNKYSLAKDQLAAMQNENKRLSAALSSIQSFVDTYNARKSEAPTVTLALPVRSSDLANFTASIGDLAKSSGVTLSNITVETSPSTGAAADNSIQVVPINLIASGSYASFRDFMIRLAGHLRIIDVGHIGLRSDESGFLQYQIHLKTYYQK